MKWFCPSVSPGIAQRVLGIIRQDRFAREGGYASAVGRSMLTYFTTESASGVLRCGGLAGQMDGLAAWLSTPREGVSLATAKREQFRILTHHCKGNSRHGMWQYQKQWLKISIGQTGAPSFITGDPTKSLCSI